MTTLNDSTFIEAFKVDLAPPGMFSGLYPDVTDSGLALQLANGFAYAQLEGWFSSNELDIDNAEVSPDLSVAGAQLVRIFAAITFISNVLHTTPGRTVAKAGVVSVEEEIAASVLSERLKMLRAQLARIQEISSGAARVLPVMIDRVSVFEAANVGGFMPGERP